MRIYLGIYPIQLAKQMRMYFNAERKERRRTAGRGEYRNKIDDYKLILRGRGKRKGIPGRGSSQDLPLKYASKVAIYLNRRKHYESVI